MNDTVICIWFFFSNIYMYALIWGYATELCQIDISFNTNVLAIGCRIIKPQSNVEWSGGPYHQQS